MSPHKRSRRFPGEQGRRGHLGRFTPVQARRSPLRAPQQVHHDLGGKVPNDQVPPKHLDDVHPKLSGQKPSHHFRVL